MMLRNAAQHHISPPSPYHEHQLKLDMPLFRRYPRTTATARSRSLSRFHRFRRARKDPDRVAGGYSEILPCFYSSIVRSDADPSSQKQHCLIPTRPGKDVSMPNASCA